MNKSNLPKNPYIQLAAILNNVSGSKIINIIPGLESIRLDFECPNTDLNKFKIIRLVLKSNPEVFYKSFTQVAALRINITNHLSICKKELFIQSAEVNTKQYIIIYCFAYNSVEAGELYLKFGNYQLYDEHFGIKEEGLFI